MKLLLTLVLSCLLVLGVVGGVQAGHVDYKLPYGTLSDVQAEATAGGPRPCTDGMVMTFIVDKGETADDYYLYVNPLNGKVMVLVFFKGESPAARIALAHLANDDLKIDQWLDLAEAKEVYPGGPCEYLFAPYPLQRK